MASLPEKMIVLHGNGTGNLENLIDANRLIIGLTAVQNGFTVVVVAIVIVFERTHFLIATTNTKTTTTTTTEIHLRVQIETCFGKN